MVPIVALRNEKGSYNSQVGRMLNAIIVALRNEKGSYNRTECTLDKLSIVALRNEKGSYNRPDLKPNSSEDCSTAK